VNWYSAAVEMVPVTCRNVFDKEKPRVLVMRDGRKKGYRDIVRIVSKIE